MNDKKVFSTLISSAYNKDDITCWRAIEAIGLAAQALAQVNLEQARDIVHRLLWSIREESGTLGWSSPEMLGEIAWRDRRSFGDIPPIILSFYDESFLLAGVIWAAARMAASGIELENAKAVLDAGLSSDDASARGLAAWAARWIAVDQEKLAELSEDERGFRLYDQGELRSLSVGAAARATLKARI